MEISAISSIAVKEEWNGKTVVIGGETGKFLVNPDEEMLEYMENRRGEELNQKKRFQEYKGKETVTASGRKPHYGLSGNPYLFGRT